MNAAAIEDWIVERVAEELSRSPDDIDPDLPFQTLGLDSATVVGLSGDLEEFLGRRLDPTLVFEYPTIRRLAAHLASEEEPLP